MPKIRQLLPLPIIPKIVCINKYMQANKLYKIVCNNTINFGDCYATTFCDLPCKKHKDHMCDICCIYICGHCFQKCPNCGV
jgi:hypothetical protein